MSNTNSYADNLKKLAENTSDILAIAEGLNEAMAGNSAEVNVTEDLAIPSFTNIVKRVDRAENTLSRFIAGKGIVEADDGSFRKIKVSTISRPPQTITGLTFSGTFNINPNWFFESLQYPRCYVNLDLTDKVEESSDRAYVIRIILDANNTDHLNFYNNVFNNNIGYNGLISLLQDNDILYKEDKDEVKFPLTYEKYYGTFGIQQVKLIQDAKGVSRLWYYVDTLAYSIVNENGEEESAGNILNVGDRIRFNNSLYTIAEINQAQNSFRLEYNIGYETLGAGDTVELYSEPFSSKVLQIGIGINEIDIIYVKGVNEEYNLLAKDWSVPISFITNDLLFEENNSVTFADYYNEHVADFGKAWIAQMKEGQIYAYNGHTPSAPILNAADMQVVQINTQLDATLDTETYNNLTTEISQTKSNITAIRNTIATNKDLLIQSTTTDQRENIQNLINTDTETLNSLTTQYNSLVEELNTLLDEAGAINYSPKYHIRGFFAIPESSDNEQIIGFDVMYRYLHTDETGIKLNTYEYSNSENIIQTGVFTDWNIMESALLEKVFDNELDKFVWKEESTADGSKININQIDIPIRSGEKVEIKVRSISEAGYPSNPLKSSWSQSIIISFPDNLTTNDTVTTILDSVKNDMTAVVLQETMSAAGVYTHFADSNSTYKHSASNIFYTDSTYDTSTKMTTIREMSVQDKITSIITTLDDNKAEILKSNEENVTTVNKSISFIKDILGVEGDDNKAPSYLNSYGGSLPAYLEAVQYSTNQKINSTDSSISYVKAEIKSLVETIHGTTDNNANAVLTRLAALERNVEAIMNVLDLNH